MNEPDPTVTRTSAPLSLSAVTSNPDTLGDPSMATPSTPACVGEYVLLGELGRGGMGIVYRAEDPRLKREVALKVMLPQFAANPQAKMRFVREARAQAKVEHDHVVHILHIADHDGLPYIVMPLLKGMTLHAALKANPRPPLSEVIRMGRETAEGLAAAHEKGLVHRDIKPANIWLEGKKLRVKVLDFGLARIVADADATEGTEGPVTREGAVVGTPAYMSPEQGRGLPVDGRTDLFSLGVMLYQMTTGELPFRGATTLAILTSLALDNPPPPISVNPAVPQALSDCVMRLLAKDPAYRPPTAEIAAEELRAIEAGLVNAVRVIPLDAPPPIILAQVGPDPFADLDATEANSAPDSHTAAGLPAEDDAPAEAEHAPTRKGFPMWALVGGVLLVVAGIVGFVASQMGKKPVEVVQEDPPKEKPPVEPKEKPLAPGDVLVLKFGYPAAEMRFRWIPPGTFSRGTPAREITISKGFWMAETECTQAQWRAIMTANPAPSAVSGNNLPVETVSATDAEEFCRELAKLTGKATRLPSEAEWEYACRAGAKTEYSSGDGEDALKKVAWYKATSGGKTHPVGELAANAWGLKDMHGNVWEWCLDGYDEGYYGKSPATDPICPTSPSANRVIRGASWNSETKWCPAAFRNSIEPSHRDGYLGLRICFGTEPGGVVSDPTFFNGTDLVGWEGTTGYWRVENREIVGAWPDGAKREPYSFLRTTGVIRDFSLSFEVKVGGHACLHFRGPCDTPKTTEPGLLLGQDWSLFLGRDKLSKPNPKVHEVVKPGEYATVQLECVGKRVTVTVNGVQTVNGEFDIPTEGRIGWGLKREADELRIRNIRFADLSKPTEPTFFNGKDLTGWEGETKLWKAENGALIGTSDPTGAPFITTAKDYTDFELSFRLVPQLGNGVS